MINIRKCDDKFAAVAPVNCQETINTFSAKVEENL